MIDTHPVAALLDDEMRARVAAAEFGLDKHGSVRSTNPSAIGLYCCPLAVAIGYDHSPSSDVLIRVLQSVGVDMRDPHRRMAVRDFARVADDGIFAPEDVKAMLGVVADDR